MIKEPESILFIRLKGIGEVVMSLGVVEVLRSRWPNARIGFLVEPPHQQLLEADRRIDRVYVFDKPRWRSEGPAQRVRDFLEFLWSLRREAYELILDLHGVPRSQWLAWVAGGRRRFGRRSGQFCDRFFDGLVSFDSREKHNIEMLLDFVPLLGLSAQLILPRVHLSEAVRGKVRQWREERNLCGSALVGLHPGAVSREPWPAEEYAQLGRLLVERLGAKVVVTAGPRERALAQDIVSAINSGHAHVACFTHLLELAALLEACAVYVAGDTGPMHLATAVGTPVVSIFLGTSDPARSGPYGKDHFVFHQFVNGTTPDHRQARCPHRLCEDSVSLEEVFQKTAEVLATRAGRTGAQCEARR